MIKKNDTVDAFLRHKRARRNINDTPTFSKAEIKKIIQNLQIKEAAGYDEVTNKAI